MPDQELIDGLIATYRELNMTVRPLPEDRLRKRAGDGGSVRDVVRRLRDDELRFSQALKEGITGVPMPDILVDETPVTGTEQEDDSTAKLIAQFGYARESTLAMLRSLPDDEWRTSLEGGKPIHTRIQELVVNDRRQLDRIGGLLGAS